MTWADNVSGARTLRDYKRDYVPILTTILASMASALPIVATAPLIPDFGFLVLITWRLLRPEIWPAQTALILGLVSDLVSGHPLGQSMALWTMLFLFLDFLDSRLMFRDYWIDWLLAAVAILFHAAGAWFIAGIMGSETRFTIMIPQIMVSILMFPVAARAVLALDRWRLGR